MRLHQTKASEQSTDNLRKGTKYLQTIHLVRGEYFEYIRCRRETPQVPWQGSEASACSHINIDLEKTQRLGVVAHACNPSTLEAKVGGSPEVVSSRPG